MEKSVLLKTELEKMLPAHALLAELNCIQFGEDQSHRIRGYASPSPAVNALIDGLWEDFMTGKIRAVCGGKTKTHCCILCCPVCKRGSKCCLECHRCKYNDCSKHKTGKYAPDVKDIGGKTIIKAQSWETERPLPTFNAWSTRVEDPYYHQLFGPSFYEQFIQDSSQHYAPHLTGVPFPKYY